MSNSADGAAPNDFAGVTADTSVSEPATIQTLQAFLDKPIPPKEPLIENLLYARDLVAFVGRRRHGKTTLACNLSLALALGQQEFLGYRIPAARRVLALLLEDDARELQDKLRAMVKDGKTEDRLHLFTRDELLAGQIHSDVQNPKFRDWVKRCAFLTRPNVIVFDNLAHLIGADYNNAPRIHQLVQLLHRLKTENDSAILVLAHPRKRNGQAPDPVRLRDSPEAFFEECMGSSHFINSMGSLWGIERDEDGGPTYFLGGTQRLTGTQATVLLEKSDDGWFELVPEFEANFPLVVNTAKRRKAWELLPEQPFTYMEALRSVKSALKSDGSFNPWWNELVRVNLVIVQAEGKYIKAGKTPEYVDVSPTSVVSSYRQIA